MRVWLRFDVETCEVALETEGGHDLDRDVTAEWDGGFFIIGPLDLEGDEA